MTKHAISALAVAISLGLVSTAEAQDWTGGSVTLGLAGVETDLNSSSGFPDGPQTETVPYIAWAYDWQTGGVTTGIIGDFTLTSTEADEAISGGKGFYGESAWFATLRGRVGVPVNDDLRVFASGGLAFMPMGANSGGPSPIGEKRTDTGVSYGLGVDYRLKENGRLTLEYLQADFGETDTITTGFPPFGSSGTLDAEVRTLRIGYVFEF